MLDLGWKWLLRPNPEWTKNGAARTSSPRQPPSCSASASASASVRRSRCSRSASIRAYSRSRKSATNSQPRSSAAGAGPSSRGDGAPNKRSRSSLVYNGTESPGGGSAASRNPAAARQATETSMHVKSVGLRRTMDPRYAEPAVAARCQRAAGNNRARSCRICSGPVRQQPPMSVAPSARQPSAARAKSSGGWPASTQRRDAAS